MDKKPETADSSCAITSTPLFCGYEGKLDFGKRASFERIDRQLMQDLEALKSHICEFDTARHIWSEIVANDNPPGRKSELRNRLELMQGESLSRIIGASRRMADALYPQNTRITETRKD